MRVNVKPLKPALLLVITIKTNCFVKKSMVIGRGNIRVMSGPEGDS